MLEVTSGGLLFDLLLKTSSEVRQGCSGIFPDPFQKHLMLYVADCTTSLGYLPHCLVSSWREILSYAVQPPLVLTPYTIVKGLSPSPSPPQVPEPQWSPSLSLTYKMHVKALQHLLHSTDKDGTEDRSHKYFDKQSPLILVCNVSTPHHLLSRTKAVSKTKESSWRKL